jgi:pyridoxal phosphate-dependent aminotransferase EpsN
LFFLNFRCQRKPHFISGSNTGIDSEMETWKMSPEALELALQDAKENGKLPKAVIVVNLYGQSAKMDEPVSVCDTYGVPSIEDAAEDH